jgi:hypothetical protein
MSQSGIDLPLLDNVPDAADGHATEPSLYPCQGLRFTLNDKQGDGQVRDLLTQARWDVQRGVAARHLMIFPLATVFV